MKTIRTHAATLAATLLLSAPLLAAGRVPNSIKYKDSSIPNATGRSGGASIEAQALLGRDAQTALTVATGGGLLQKVQLKYSGVTHNENSVGAASYATQIAGLSRHETLQVQANVSDNDSRTGVVTLEETVKLRPDLAVADVSPSGRVVAGMPSEIVATLSEGNGDVGARTNALLSVNGNVVDQARNVWVDAAGVVHCAFVYTFPTAGNYDIAVSATDVSPGDWDEANNTKSATVRVSGDHEFNSWSAHVWQEYTDAHYRSTSTDSGSESTEKSWDSVLRFDAVFPTSINLYGEGFNISIKEVTDGRTIVDFRYPGWGYGGNFADGTVCSEIWGRHLRGSACSKDGVTHASMIRVAGYAYYFSRGWFYAYHDDGSVTEDEYYAYDMDDQYGIPYEYGSTVQLQFIAENNGGTWEADPFIVMQPYDKGTTHTTTCGTSWCSDVTKHVYGREGSASSD